MQNLLYLALAALSGAAMALQGTLNAALGKVLGIWHSTLLVHIIGTITTLVIILVIGAGMHNFSKIGQVPWYAFLGGVLNVAIIYLVTRTIPQIGVGNATTAIIVAQVLTAVLIDGMGAFGMKKYEFHYIDLLGIALLAAGARILLID
ncbi:DMT family transporter [Thermosyntropha sp.]|uniref:DMT family transporter n=1 Tax=Thermosyntropha sp. TaxID=2740820 RepID=UPI0025CD3BB0|nr:DMT family transporter [Thermosyntropha sp.]MBO8158353.1 DMT family transporter [Thermosyntropha sp.]